ncbi:MAG: SOS response-associated peptidase [Pseudomonadales bacterium]|nr:SOS response-associated peptidase [Pseudomonadales bacterium]
MCGRMNVSDDPAVQWLWSLFNVSFDITSNPDLCPSQSVATMIWENNEIQQRNATWGIKPGWSKKLIINAQSETAHSKKTFQSAFESQRCLIPCNGWYEWREEGDARKQKYYFSHPDGIPFLMAGIRFVGGSTGDRTRENTASQIVTLTTKPNKQCAEIHKRMPVLINPENVDSWFGSDVKDVRELLLAVEREFDISKC